MKINVKNRAGLILPSKAYGDSVGWDLKSISEPRIVGESVNMMSYEQMGFGKLYTSINFIEYDCGLQIEPLPDKRKKYYTILCPRSSISNKNLMLKNSVGIIDSNYRGSLLLRFFYTVQSEDLVLISESGIQRLYNRVNTEKIYHSGDAIAQLIISEVIPSELNVVEFLEATHRAEGGFGSSDKIK